MYDGVAGNPVDDGARPDPQGLHVVGEVVEFLGHASTDTLTDEVRGRAQFIERMMAMRRGTRTTMRCLIPPAVTIPASRPLHLLHPLQTVDTRAVFDSSVLSEPDGIERLRMAERACGPIRMVGSLTIAVVIADDREAMVAMVEGDDVVGAVVGPSPAIPVIAAMHELLWRQATPYRVEAGRRGDEPPTGDVVDDLDRQMLLLLAAGATESAVARRTGTSVRTVQRRLARLADRLGASTRFQAAVHAAKRGWI